MVDMVIEETKHVLGCLASSKKLNNATIDKCRAEMMVKGGRGFANLLVYGVLDADHKEHGLWGQECKLPEL